MAKPTQAGLEQQLDNRLAEIESGKMTPEKAFGTIEDWVIDLGERKAFLHPNLKQWMWHDRLHDEWVYTGYGVGEAILLTLGGVGGIKKLPEPGAIDDWCVYQQEQEMHGPLRLEELRRQLDSQEVSQDIQIWSTRASDWFSLTDPEAHDIVFANDAP